MRIAQIEFAGFRGIRTGCITLPQHGALLGANNVGKTAVTDALALLFGRERVAYQLSDWDFFGGQPKPHSRFTIICTVTDFVPDDPHEHPEWFGGESAAQPVWLHNDESTVTFEPDRPEGGNLAAQIALCARYDEENCEFETKRYFYHGPSDPFTDGCDVASLHRVQELGVFILPGNRQWDRLLSFGSSSFLKALRQSDAIPGDAIEKLKTELRAPRSTIEESSNFKPLLEAAEGELRRFMMLQSGGHLAYRPTSLDTSGVLQSLLPHIRSTEGALLPLGRHGAGMVSLQAFLIVLAIAEKRKAAGKNFILVAEEPELHLHPSLHKRLANRIRSVSTQSLITTHSPLIAATYKPVETVFLHNNAGVLTAQRLRTEPVKAIRSNSIRKLYLQKREAFYEAILSGGVIVPEGEGDYEWLRLLQRIVESSEEAGSLDVAPLSVVPTQDGAVADTYAEVARFRPEAMPIVDGDHPGETYLDGLSKVSPPPKRVVRLGKGAAIEALVAWILEPALSTPGPALGLLLPKVNERDLRALQRALTVEANKKDRELRENLAMEALEKEQCVVRAAEFFGDLGAILSGSEPKNPEWKKQTHSSGLIVYAAEHIHKGP